MERSTKTFATTGLFPDHDNRDTILITAFTIVDVRYKRV
jgi:hypothetical protein